MKQIKRDKRRSHKRVSRTDPEDGHIKRPGKPRGQYYLSHQTTDAEWGIITGVTVTPGDVYDSILYLEQLEHIHRKVIPVQAAAADSAYDFPLAHRALKKLGIDFFAVPQPAHDCTSVELKWDAFSYDAEQDAYICSTGKQLRLIPCTAAPGSWSIAISHRSGSGIWLTDITLITGMRSKSGRSGARALLPLRNGDIIYRASCGGT